MAKLKVEKQKELNKALESKRKKLVSVIENLNVERQKEAQARQKFIEKEKIIQAKLAIDESKMQADLEEQKDAEIHSILKERTSQLRSKLKKEFQDKLKLEMQRKEAELEQKKIAIEQEIQQKAKELFS